MKHFYTRILIRLCPSITCLARHCRILSNSTIGPRINTILLNLILLYFNKVYSLQMFKQLKHKEMQKLQNQTPEQFMCPITGQVMKDPVVLHDGHTYQRQAIVAWFAKGKRTSPITNLQLKDLQLRTNFTLKNLIQKFRTNKEKTKNEGNVDRNKVTSNINGNSNVDVNRNRGKSANKPSSGQNNNTNVVHHQNKPTQQVPKPAINKVQIQKNMGHGQGAARVHQHQNQQQPLDMKFNQLNNNGNSREVVNNQKIPEERRMKRSYSQDRIKVGSVNTNINNQVPLQYPNNIKQQNGMNKPPKPHANINYNNNIPNNMKNHPNEDPNKYRPQMGGNINPQLHPQLFPQSNNVNIIQHNQQQQQQQQQQFPYNANLQQPNNFHQQNNRPKMSHGYHDDFDLPHFPNFQIGHNNMNQNNMNNNHFNQQPVNPPFQNFPNFQPFNQNMNMNMNRNMYIKNRSSSPPPAIKQTQSRIIGQINHHPVGSMPGIQQNNQILPNFPINENFNHNFNNLMNFQNHEAYSNMNHNCQFNMGHMQNMNNFHQPGMGYFGPMNMNSPGYSNPPLNACNLQQPYYHPNYQIPHCNNGGYMPQMGHFNNNQNPQFMHPPPCNNQPPMQFYGAIGIGALVGGMLGALLP